jgi:transcription-repair coupling factor (superfamily II helicase)
MDSRDWPQTLLKHPKIKEFCTLQEDCVCDELSSSALATLLHLTSHKNHHIVILTSRGHESRLINDLSQFFKDRVVDYPAWETLPSEETAPSPDVVGERYELLNRLSNSKEPLVIITSLQAVLQKLVSIKTFKNNFLELQVGSSIGHAFLQEMLVEMGYHLRTLAADKGEFAVRGGIIDCFAVSHPLPYRIEFFGDEIVSIRTFDPISQTTIEKKSSVTITLGQEMEVLSQEEHLATLFDYLGKDTLFILDDLSTLEDKYYELKKTIQFSKSFISLEELFQETLSLRKLYLTKEPLETLSASLTILEKEGPLPKVEFDFFNRKLQAVHWRPPFYSIHAAFCPPHLSPEEFSLADFFTVLSHFETEVHFLYDKHSELALLEKASEQKKLTFEKGYLSSGFYINTPPFALVSLAELSHRHKIVRQKQRTYTHQESSEFFALTPGEHVVHMQNGVGRFLGVEKRPNHLGIETEYMVLEYAEGGTLYAPMHQANLISKYIGVDDKTPQLHTIGSLRWQRTRERTEEAIVGYASDLLKLQATRTFFEGEGYGPNSDLVQQFSEEFAYEETEDQAKAIELVHEKLQAKQLMDALVLGDVGFGKTEVAMRAAFKTVVDGGKQVAVLVPTTVLAMQHYETFKERMANFPVKIGIVSRFCKPKEIKETLAALAIGNIDILVGTHRLVSKDVVFKDLGLIVIDEEQRFGVRTKEQLKKLKKEINCLTLSATPIPRTLYLSLIGIRDLAVINTPPQDRLPIQSIVAANSDTIFKTAILRELARDGQIFIIHNRIETIFTLADRISSIVPGAKIVVGHGQMDADDLDEVIHKFKRGDADILVATSIIENGIDIPNANTILIDRADSMGLSDLYQMRGRVGRWNRKAYCYFLVPNPSKLNEISRKRLHSLLAASGPGGGMKIAMHDLEIRGAGNILGVEQSGFVATIGFHLYCKLLKKAMKSLEQKQQPFTTTDVKLEFPYNATLPESYINDTQLRMQFYQRLGDAVSGEEVDKLFMEMQDRFGTPPMEVLWLGPITKIRIFASQNHFTLIKLTQVMLQAEQSHGKKNKLIKKILFKPPKRPDDLEATVLFALKQNFPVK